MGVAARARASFDIRQGEGVLAASAFIILFLLVAAHSLLETARDALFLSRLPVRQLNVVYVLIAISALVFGRATAYLTRRVGNRGALLVSIGAMAATMLALYVVGHRPWTSHALYVASGVFGAVALPQFWGLVGGAVNIGQGRRLFGFITAAGTIGSVAGSLGAGLFVHSLPVALLLPAGCALLVGTGVAVTVSPLRDALPVSDAGAPQDRSAFREEPFLLTIALLVVLSTATVLTVDFLFKASVARTIAPDHMARFFARFYAALNIASALIQVFVAAALVRRIGVAASAAVVPLSLLLGSVGTIVLGGAFALALATKSIDGVLRYSLHRVSMELLYLPVAPRLRASAKPLIDGAVSRSAQALVAILLFVTAIDAAGPTTLAWLVAVLASMWLTAAIFARTRYLDALRRALSSGGLDAEREREMELDLRGAELVVERLASPRPGDVVAAIRVLDRWHRGGLLPAVILHHEDASVLEAALEVFMRSSRRDWVPLCETLLRDPREEVRFAAVRALAERGVADPLEVPPQDDRSLLVRAYRETRILIGTPDESVDLDHLLRGDESESQAVRRGVLVAIADAGRNAPVQALLSRLSVDATVARSAELARMMVQAVEKHPDPALVAFLLRFLRRGDVREDVRRALVAIGRPALDAMISSLRDRSFDPRLRAHLPRTISRFPSRVTVDVLLETIENDPDGLVRFRSLRALGRLVVDHAAVVDRRRIDRLATRELTEYVRLLAIRAHVHADEPASEAYLLAELLDDKLAQCLDRVFRLVKLVHPTESVRMVHRSTAGVDAPARGNAVEFLAALLGRMDETLLRQALVAVLDDLPAQQRAERASRALGIRVATSPDEARRALAVDADAVVAAFATCVARDANRDA